MLCVLLLLRSKHLLIEKEVRHTGIPNKACCSITVYCCATHKLIVGRAVPGEYGSRPDLLRFDFHAITVPKSLRRHRYA
jgi:hypothetical protein